MPALKAGHRSRDPWDLIADRVDVLELALDLGDTALTAQGKCNDGTEEHEGLANDCYPKIRGHR